MGRLAMLRVIAIALSSEEKQVIAEYPGSVG
jgi:hypothetical protein